MFPIFTYQEGKLFSDFNADTPTTHLAQMEILLEMHNIDASRFWNLNETGGKPGRDVSGNSHKWRYMRRDGHGDFRIPDFA